MPGECVAVSCRVEVGKGTASARSLSGEPSLDQLLAEPIVQQLMRRDGTDEAAIRRLLQRITAAPSTIQTDADPGTDSPN